MEPRKQQSPPAKENRKSKAKGVDIQGRARDERPLEEIRREGMEIDETTALTPQEEKEYDKSHGKGWPRSG